MQQHFAHFETLYDVGKVLWYNVQVCEEQGVIRQSYHFTPVFDAPNSARTVVQARGFDQEWLKLYEKADFRSKDPVPERTMNHGQLLTWQDARRLEPNTPENEEYFAAMEAHGLIHGFGVPLYGPKGRNAYASFDLGRPLEEISDECLGIIRSVSQVGHQRICVLLDKARNLPDLSEREAEVLQWIVRGKSLSVIAEILELSPDTVKTYSKRIYAKLEASDRVGAVIKALKLGVVTA